MISRTCTGSRNGFFKIKSTYGKKVYANINDVHLEFFLYRKNMYYAYLGNREYIDLVGKDNAFFDNNKPKMLAILHGMRTFISCEDDIQEVNFDKIVFSEHLI